MDIPQTDLNGAFESNIQNSLVGTTNAHDMVERPGCVYNHRESNKKGPLALDLEWAHRNSADRVRWYAVHNELQSVLQQVWDNASHGHNCTFVRSLSPEARRIICDDLGFELSREFVRFPCCCWSWLGWIVMCCGCCSACTAPMTRWWVIEIPERTAVESSRVHYYLATDPVPTHE